MLFVDTMDGDRHGKLSVGSKYKAMVFCVFLTRTRREPREGSTYCHDVFRHSDGYGFGDIQIGSIEEVDARFKGGELERADDAHLRTFSRVP